MEICYSTTASRTAKASEWSIEPVHHAAAAAAVGLVSAGMEVKNSRYVRAGRINIDVKLTTDGNNGLVINIDRTSPVSEAWAEPAGEKRCKEGS